VANTAYSPPHVLPKARYHQFDGGNGSSPMPRIEPAPDRSLPAKAISKHEDDLAHLANVSCHTSLCGIAAPCHDCLDFRHEWWRIVSVIAGHHNQAQFFSSSIWRRESPMTYRPKTPQIKKTAPRSSVAQIPPARPINQQDRLALITQGDKSVRGLNSIARDCRRHGFG